MEKLQKTLEKIGIDRQIALQDIPDIDLYIDQVIQLFENTYRAYQRNPDDKVLTKTMINNYAKGKIFFPIKNKKYSKEHVILISLIYQLKGGLTLGDIKTTLKGLNDRIVEGSIDLEEFYQSYLNLLEKNSQLFSEEAEVRVTEAKKEAEKFADEDDDYLEKVLHIASFIAMSNYYRRMAEEFVDELMKNEINGEQEKKK